MNGKSQIVAITAMILDDSRSVRLSIIIRFDSNGIVIFLTI